MELLVKRERHKEVDRGRRVIQKGFITPPLSGISQLKNLNTLF